MNYKITTKGVAFNILDPDQAELLEHAMKRKNFSAYIKRLIHKDMYRIETPGIIQIPADVEEDVLDDSLMENLI